MSGLEELGKKMMNKRGFVLVYLNFNQNDTTIE